MITTKNIQDYSFVEFPIEDKALADIGIAPKDQTVKVGTTAIFALDPLIISKTPPPQTFQWYRKEYRSDAQFSPIQGANSSTYTTDAVTLSDNGAMFLCYINGVPAGGPWGYIITGAYLYVYAEGEKLGVFKELGAANTVTQDSIQPQTFIGKMWKTGAWLRTGAQSAEVMWSVDGKNWNSVLDKGPHQDTDMNFTGVFSVNNSYYLMGGQHLNGQFVNNVFSSLDMINWKTLPNAPWAACAAARLIECNGRLFKIGGGTTSWCTNEIQSMGADGIWRVENANPSFSPRMDHEVCKVGATYYLFGGRNPVNGQIYNDVYTSTDCINWTKIANAPWLPRYWFKSVVYNDRYIVISGGEGENHNQYSDFWYFDSGTWKQIHFVQNPRHTHAPGFWNFAKKIYHVFGSTFRNGRPQTDDAALEFDAEAYFGTVVTPSKYTLMITSNNGTVTKEPDLISYDPAAIVKLTANPLPGFEFKSWSGDVTGTDPIINVTMNSNKNITANIPAIVPVDPTKPIAYDQVINTKKDTSVNFSLTGSENTFRFYNQNGSSVSRDDANINYDPAPGFIGTDIKKFTCINDKGVESDPATITINIGATDPVGGALKITTQPQNKVLVGASVTLTVVVSGGKTPYGYQWKKGSESSAGKPFVANPDYIATEKNFYKVNVKDANGVVIGSNVCYVS